MAVKKQAKTATSSGNASRSKIITLPKIKKLSAKQHKQIITTAKSNTTKALHKALAALD